MSERLETILRTPGPWYATQLDGDPFHWAITAPMANAVVATLDRRQEASTPHLDRTATDAQMLAAGPTMAGLTRDLMQVIATHIRQEDLSPAAAVCVVRAGKFLMSLNEHPAGVGMPGARGN